MGLSNRSSSDSSLIYQLPNYEIVLKIPIWQFFPVVSIVIIVASNFGKPLATATAEQKS